jgi:hypothetical protein
MSAKQIPLQKHLSIVSDLKRKLDEARCERDEARVKAIEEAAAVAFARDLSIMSSTAVDIEARKIGNAILALKDKPQ